MIGEIDDSEIIGGKPAEAQRIVDRLNKEAREERERRAGLASGQLASRSLDDIPDVDPPKVTGTTDFTVDL